MKAKLSDSLRRQWMLMRSIPRAPRKLTAAELQCALDAEGIVVTRRTVERDLVALSEVFPIEVDDREKPYGWSWNKDSFAQFLPRMSVPEAVALSMAQQSLSTLLPTAWTDDLRHLFQSAQATLKESQWQKWASRTAYRSDAFLRMSPKINPTVLRTLELSLINERQVEGTYRSKWSTEAKSVRLSPLGIFVRGSTTYVVGTMFDYSDVRVLALHRFSNAAELTDKVRIPPGFNFQNYLAASDDLHSRGLIKLRAVFSAESAEHLSELSVSADQQLERVDEDHVQLKATVLDDDRLRWWLLSFGAQVEVESPKALRKWMAAEVQELAAKYR